MLINFRHQLISPPIGHLTPPFHNLTYSNSQLIVKLSFQTNCLFVSFMSNNTKSHFTSSVKRSFPLSLLLADYVRDKYSNRLVSSPLHIRGQNVSILDLTNWSNIINSIQRIESNTDYVIKNLLINNHEEVDDHLLQYLSTNVRIVKNLIRFDLSNAVGSITINGLKLISSLFHIQIIDLSHITIVDDALIQSLFLCLKSLHSINLSYCSSVTNIALEHIALLAGDRLKCLKISNNTNISFAGIDRVVFKCERLQTLDVAKCTRINFLGKY